MPEPTPLLPLPRHRARRIPVRLLVAIGWMQAAAALSGEEVVRLARLDVVGTPLVAPATTDAFGTTVTRLNAAQLDTLNSSDLPSALRHTPGATISRYNPVGSFGGAEGGAVFLRGLGSSRPGGELKTFLDGVPLLNGVFNHPLLDLVSVDAAGSIDVLHRVAPLDGGNAFAAVRLTSPRLEKRGLLLRGTAAAGSFGTWMVRGTAAENTGDSDAWVTVSRRESDGDRPSSSGRLGTELARFAWKLPEGLEFSYVVNHTDNLATDPGPQGVTEGPANTRGETYATEGWTHIAALVHRNRLGEGSFRAYYGKGTGDWLRRDFSGNPDSINRWKQHGMRWRETLRPRPDTEIVTGADIDSVRGSSLSVPSGTAAPTGFESTTFRLLSAYSGISQQFGTASGMQFTPSAGVRHYRHNQFGNAWAPQAAATLTSGRTQIRAAFSRGLNYPGIEVAALATIANPALGSSWQTLRPERLDQWEFGVRHAFSAKVALDATLFRNEGRNRYVVVPPPPPPPRFANLERFRTTGAEVALHYTPNAGLAVFAAASILRTDPGDLPYSPHTSLTAGVNWRPAAAWLVSADAQYVSTMHVLSQARTAGAPNPTTVGSQLLVNARVARSFAWQGAGRAHRIELFVAGENLLGRRVAYRPGYPMPGAGLTGGVTVEW